MYPVSCTNNTHHDVTDLVNHGFVKLLKIQKLEYFENETKLFYGIKKS